MRISRRIKVTSDSISESTGVLNLPNTPNGQASGEITPNSAASELRRFETSVFPSPPPDESVTSFEMTDAGSPPTVNHVGHEVSPPNEVWLMTGSFLYNCMFSLPAIAFEMVSLILSGLNRFVFLESITYKLYEGAILTY